MACYVTKVNGSNCFICGEFGPYCADCLDVAENLCDFPVGKGKTCDRNICLQHSHEIAPSTHYCDDHHKQWQEFERTGGVREYLSNVQPYKPAQP